MLVTNILVMGIWSQTHQKLQETALELFQLRGYDAVTTAEIAKAAGVAEVTLFRHFPTKEKLVLGDPFDPLIADFVMQQPQDCSPFEACICGVRQAIRGVDTPLLERRLLILVDSGISASAISRNNEPTIDAIAGALRQRGASPMQSRVVAAGFIAGLSEGLFTWAQAPKTDFQEAFLDILAALEHAC